MAAKLQLNRTHQSPNFGERPKAIIDTIIIHYTEMKSEIAAIEKLCDIEAVVSSHYLISKSGEIFQLVDDEKRAHHAGNSHWGGRNNVNDFSIGIELDNNGHEFFVDKLMTSLTQLCHHLIDKYKIKKSNILGHSDIAPMRKQDPGIYFDWIKLSQNKIGMIPNFDEFIDTGEQINIKQMAELLEEFGYDKSLLTNYDEKMKACLEAFSTHYLGLRFSEDNLPKIIYALNNLITYRSIEA